MYGRRMVFGGVVCFVVWTWFPVYVKLALFGTITDPTESCFKTTHFLLASVIVYNAMRCGVVCFERSSRFWMIVAQLL